MKNKPTVFGTVAGMTGLIGLLPLLVTFFLSQSTDWNALALTAAHLVLMGIGAWAFSVWFGN